MSCWRAPWPASFWRGALDRAEEHFELFLERVKLLKGQTEQLDALKEDLDTILVNRENASLLTNPGELVQGRLQKQKRRVHALLCQLPDGGGKLEAAAIISPFRDADGQCPGRRSSTKSRQLVARRNRSWTPASSKPSLAASAVATRSGDRVSRGFFQQSWR